MRTHYIVAVILSLSIATTVAQERRVTLLFAGDAMMHTPQIHAAKTDSGYSFHSVFDHLKDQIAAADIAGVNLETTFGGLPYTGYPAFSSPTDYATALHAAGFNIFFTANNHALDTGKKGLEQTIQTIRQLGAKQTGTFATQQQRDLHYPLMIVKNGIRIALLNYTYGTNGLKVKQPNIINLIDTTLIQKDIAAAQLLQPDIMIAVMHWGEEYQTKPSAQQKSLAQFLFRHQVRIIIGHHPHVVQPLQTYHANNNSTDSTDSITHTVFYSLGNFLSNQRKPNTDGGLLAHIVLSKAHGTAPVTIERADHSLVWVHKYFEGNKPVYRLLPVEKALSNSNVSNDSITDGNNNGNNGNNSSINNRYNLQPYEMEVMKGFVKRVAKIMGE